MSFEGLYNRISPRLRIIARRYSNGSVFTKQDDLYQEMCIYLWENYKEGGREGINDAYIIKGCEFHVRNYLRVKREKTRMLSLESPIDEEGNTLKELIPFSCEDLDREVDRKITIDSIMNNGFTKREKEVFEFLIKGFTVREIGARLGISHVMVVKLKKSLIKKWQREEKRLPGA